MKQLITLFILVALTGGSALAQCSSSSTDDNQVAKKTPTTIVSVAQEAGSFNTLLQAATAAGLVDTLTSAGPFTVFAPTDEAFAKLPDGTLEALLNDKEKLKAILLYHVVPGEKMAAEVVSSKTLTSAQGSSIEINASDAGVKVDNANIVKTDIKAGNGVIHVIDSVILP